MNDDTRNLVALKLQNAPVAGPMALLQSNVDLDKLERVWQMQVAFELHEAVKAYNRAFAAFKDEAVKVLRNRKITDGPLKGKRYAELHAFVDAITPALSAHGLSASWKLTKDEKDWIEVTCTLKHVQGHSESVSMSGQPDTGPGRNAIQARASTVTYLERYTLKAICGVSEQGDDDDGNGGPTKPENKASPELLAEAKAEARKGKAALKAWWKAATWKDREALTPHKGELDEIVLATESPRRVNDPFVDDMERAEHEGGIE